MDELLSRTVFEGYGQLAFTVLVLLGAQTIYALYGFGSGLLSVAVLAFAFSDLSSVVVLLLLVNLPTELWVVWRDRAAVPLAEIGALLVFLALATPVGALALRQGVGQRWPFLALGGLLLAFSLLLLLVGSAGPTSGLPRGSAAAAGTASGLLAGLFGTGGPPLIVYFRLRGLPKASFRAALLAVFLATSAVRIPAYVATGLADSRSVGSALLVLPACLLGLAAGQSMHRSVSEESFRRGTAIVLGILGGLLLLRG